MIFTRGNWQAVKESPDWVLFVAVFFFGGLTLMTFFVVSDPIEIVLGVIAFGTFFCAALLQLILRFRRRRSEAGLNLHPEAEIKYTPNKSLEQPE